MVNNLNQYTNVSDTAANYDPTYDLNGNFLSDGQVWTYEYDIQNRLTLAVNTVGGAMVSIEYDPLGRMSARELNGAGRIEMVYDGTALLVQVDAAGAVTDRWAWGPGVDEPVAWSFGAGILSRRYILTDHQGSIIGRAQTNGSSDFIHFYDEWGVVKDTALMNFKYTGQYYDTTLGLYYYKARWYSPTLGRFLNPDPIGFEDNPNLYAYVNNDPVNGRDPSGEAAQRVAARGAAFFGSAVGRFGARALFRSCRSCAKAVFDGLKKADSVLRPLAQLANIISGGGVEVPGAGDVETPEAANDNDKPVRPRGTTGEVGPDGTKEGFGAVPDGPEPGSDSPLNQDSLGNPNQPSPKDGITPFLVGAAAGIAAAISNLGDRHKGPNLREGSRVQKRETRIENVRKRE